MVRFMTRQRLSFSRTKKIRKISAVHFVHSTNVSKQKSEILGFILFGLNCKSLVLEGLRNFRGIVKSLQLSKGVGWGQAGQGAR